MSRSVLTFLALLAIAIPGGSSDAHAVPASPDGVVLVSSSEARRCATGIVLAGGAVIVNYHFAQHACPGLNRCPGLALARSPGLGEPPVPMQPGAVSLKSLFPAVDLALLDAADALPLEGLTPAAAAPQPGTAVRVLGHPRCGALVSSEGVIADPSSLFFDTGAAGSYGSSGSAVVTAAGELVGIVDEGSNVAAAALAAALGTPFAMRAVRADVLTQLAALSAGETFEAQAFLLARYHHLDIAPRTGLRRMRRAIDLLHGTDQLARAAALSDLLSGDDESRILRLLLVRGDRAAAPPSEAGATQRVGTVGLLVETYRTEYHRLLRNAVLAGAGALVLALLWSASLGYVYRAARGSRLRRVAVTAALAPFWPVSLVLFRAFRRPPAAGAAKTRS